MKLSDYIADFLAKKGSNHVWLVSGGAIVHCVDSAEKHPDMTLICSEHEQGAGASADGFSRISGKLGAVMVTSGPGATNLLTSVCNAYFDSVPFIMICGQVATFRIKRSAKLRQKGFQETELKSIFSSVTNYVGEVRDPREIKYELQKAYYMATHARPGPVILDVPDDIQRADINPDELPDFLPVEEKIDTESLGKHAAGLHERIKKAKRPVLICGAGVGIAGAREEVIKFAEYHGLPVLLTWGGKDLLPHDHPLNMGVMGVAGPRYTNFAAQCSDLVIGLGTRLSQLIVGGKTSLFAPKAVKVMIDVDYEELTKFTEHDFKLDIGIRSELKDFFGEYEKQYSGIIDDTCENWRVQIREWQEKYPLILPANTDRKGKVDGLIFNRELSRFAKEGDCIIADTGANLAWLCQAFEVKKGQRIISAWSHTPMGYALPASIGAACAAGEDVLCVTGDGGIMMSLEELGTIRRNNTPVKIFVMYNHGHGIQRQTMDTWLNSKYTGCDVESGLYFPDFVKIAEAFEIPSVVINNNAEISKGLKKVFSQKGPVLCIVEIDREQKIVPMLKFGAGLEDLDPKLPQEEIDSILKLRDS